MSTLLEQASLIMIPSGYKEDVVYSVIPETGAGDLSFTRASNGTRINSAGLVEVVPWNLMQYSEDFSNAIYSLTGGATITTNTTTAPNGTLTADTLVIANGQYLYQYINLVAGQSYTISVYLRVASGTKQFKFNTYGNGNDFTSSPYTATSEWQRFEYTFTAVASGSTGIYPALVDGLPSATFFIWGAQFNIGATAKPYFPTTDRLNVPRLTYQNGGGGCPSLLLEKQSTNLLLNSEDFTNVTWAGNSGVVANSTISPDETQNADTNNSTGIYPAIGIGDATITNTASIFAKANPSGASTMTLRVNLYGSGTDYLEVNFNLSTGIAGAVTNSGTASGGVASMVSFGNGWYRCILTGVVSTTFGLLSFNPQNNCFIWGAQVEASSYPTSYIPTTSASATRVADACSKTGISSLIGQTEGTILWDIQVDIASGPESILNLDAGSFANTIYLIKGTNSSLGVEMYASSILQSTFTLSSITAGRYKMAIGYANNNTAFFINGTQVGTTDTSCSVPAMSRLQMGSTIFGPSDGKVNQTILFPTRLTNAELASLTTI